MTSDLAAPTSRSARVYDAIRCGILDGDYEPMQPLSPQELATRFGVSLAVVREALLRLVGEGLADRLHNRGFAVPAADDARWQEIAEARATLEPQIIRLAVDRGDVAWEARIRSAHHALSRTPARNEATGAITKDWVAAHHTFHRTLLEGCANAALLDTFERLWNASELTRLWASRATPDRDHAAEHAALERACLERDPDRAAALLFSHLDHTAAALRSPAGPDSQKIPR